MNAFSGGGSLSIRHKARPSVLHTIRVTYLTYFVLYVTGHGSTAEDEGQILSAAEVVHDARLSSILFEVQLRSTFILRTSNSVLTPKYYQ